MFRLPAFRAPLTPRARSAWMAAAVAALSLLLVTLAAAGWLAWRNPASARSLAAAGGNPSMVSAVMAASPAPTTTAARVVAHSGSPEGSVNGSAATASLTGGGAAPVGVVPALATAAPPAAVPGATIPPALLALAVLATCLVLVCGVVLLRRPQVRGGRVASTLGLSTLPPPHDPEPGDLVLRRVPERARPAGFTGSAELARLQQALAALQVGVRDLPANGSPAAGANPRPAAGRGAQVMPAMPAAAAAAAPRGRISMAASRGSAGDGAVSGPGALGNLGSVGSTGAVGGSNGGTTGSHAAAGTAGMTDAPRPLTRAVGAVAGLSPLAGMFGAPVQPAAGSRATDATVPALPRPSVQSLTEAAQRAVDTVGELAARLEEIGQVSRRIVDGVGVIEGIALQSSTLALQASLDAARAGDRGRASSVVAADIRLLGQKAAHAAREIHGLVSPVLQRLQQGAGLGDAGQTLRNMLDLLQGATELLAGSARPEEMGEALRRVETLTRDQAGLVRQAAAVAEGLRLQAERLHKVAQAFRQLQQTQEAAWTAQCAITDARRSARMAALPASAADPRADDAPSPPLPKPGKPPG